MKLKIDSPAAMDTTAFILELEDLQGPRRKNIVVLFCSKKAVYISPIQN